MRNVEAECRVRGEREGGRAPRDLEVRERRTADCRVLSGA